MNTEPNKLRIQDFTYELPAERIAEAPLAERDQSRLLIYQNGQIRDELFRDLSHFLPRNAELVLNNTRVIEARLLFQKPTGGMIEIFCLEPAVPPIETALSRTGSVDWNCLIGGASKWKPGQVLQKKLIHSNTECLLEARFLEKKSDHFVIRFSWQPDGIAFGELLHAAGFIPLPPYIKRDPAPDDSVRYQTVFAEREGSVAAPTAALHFTQNTFDGLSSKGIRTHYLTLHVGAGTFKPVKSETIAGHTMHQEPFSVHRSLIAELMDSETVIAVGTTTLRSLETLYWLGVKQINSPGAPWTLGQWEAYELARLGDLPSVAQTLGSILGWMEDAGMDELHCETSLIIVPGYRFRIPAALVTNFHQPQSTLLLLVAAFIGPDWKKVYQHALDQNYRFLSYGDSSLLWKNESLG